MPHTTLQLMSWNVAGWDATLRYIKTYYSGLPTFLERHQCDILALQEVKITRAKAQADPASAAALPLDGGWESFWAFPASSSAGKNTGTAKRGFNGVTTYAKKGLTLQADAAPLGDPALDGEGRCLLTDHGGFVLLNVYAHATTAGEGEGEDSYRAKLGRKLAFLNALRAKMTRLRDAGRNVILCGDLNIAARGADVPWRQSLLPMTVLRLGGDDEEEAAAPSPATREDAAAGSSSSSSRVASSSAPAPAAAAVSIAADAAVQAFHAALRGTVSSDPTASSYLEALADALGSSGGSRGLVPAGRVAKAVHECRAWLRALLDDDGMVDSFATLRPDAMNRFTCWHQYKNQRYANCGRRIDYFIVDRALFGFAQAGASLIEDDSETGALRAATAAGRWLPAPTHGALTGLQEAKQTTHDTQFAPPHTGIVYTAPQSSDHVAVTLLFSAEVLGRAIGAPCPAFDEATRACTFRPPRTLQSFFGAKPKAAAAVASSSAAPPAAAAVEGNDDTKRQRVG